MKRKKILMGLGYKVFWILKSLVNYLSETINILRDFQMTKILGGPPGILP